MKKNIPIILALLLCASHLNAKVTLPCFIGDNMVLQQNTDAALWGKAAPGAKVTVSPSWTKEKSVTYADAVTGKWIIHVATPSAGGPYTITFSDGKDRLTISNVLTGEVWFCSGQSNMEMPVQGWGGQPVEGCAEIIMKAKPSIPIRMCTVPRGSKVTAQDTVGFCSWQENEPQAVAGTSAIAYFFAKKLQEVLDVPVGVLIADWGASTIWAWMDRETLQREFPQVNLVNLEERQVKNPNTEPTLLYNGMVNALVPYTFKGMLWYQGEADRARYKDYASYQCEYVKMMRKLFEVPQAPFYFVQIAPYSYYDAPYTSGYFNEAQQKAEESIPFCGMAPTVDIGESYIIHPRKKMQVSERLAMLALVNDYGLKGIEARAPRYKSLKVEGSKAIVTFDVRSSGLAPIDKDKTGFEIAGEDRVFHPAKVTKFKSKEVTLECDLVKEPVAVRYCFRNWCVGSIANGFGVPLLPFRTDDWPLE